MESVLGYWLRWPSSEYFLSHYAWAWPLCEVVHFFGIVLLVGIVGVFDLRVLGVLKGLPLAPLQRPIPWAILDSSSVSHPDSCL